MLPMVDFSAWEIHPGAAKRPGPLSMDKRHAGTTGATLRPRERTISDVERSENAKRQGNQAISLIGG
ncbi:hypothetical protein AGR3A_Cc180017 [Agrobacterium tomkonis CFBP 6623]|uniref:Uncharacterized protein n=1 Tax=Agrobacterium tomkonis CFBP 6623 TaxID=1183432 RepID=A0A1S7NYQ3_9HYPH|nr:hypothetical protein AGR3A_Cc180017 [Agrobacterium tomkonis CFBP 6623]